MPILFKLNNKRSYFITKYSGHISNEEHIESFKSFFTGNDWIPGMNELAIASNIKGSSININSLRTLLNFKNNYYERHKISHIKIAIYAPGDLAFGIARMYDTLAEAKLSPEEVKPFRDIRKAIRWLKEQ